MSDDKLLNKISENLSRIRKEQRYTQRELAELAGLNPNYYAKVERGEKTPSLKTLYLIAKAMKITITEIVGY